MGQIAATTDATFNADVIDASKNTTVLVDFWATWCGPCKALNPHLEAMAEDLDGQLQVVKVNIEEAPQTPQRFGVSSVPTLLVFKGGELADKVVGNPGPKRLKEFVQRNLG